MIIKFLLNAISKAELTPKMQWSYVQILTSGITDFLWL